MGQYTHIMGVERVEMSERRQLPTTTTPSPAYVRTLRITTKEGWIDITIHSDDPDTLDIIDPFSLPEEAMPNISPSDCSQHGFSNEDRIELTIKTRYEHRKKGKKWGVWDVIENRFVRVWGSDSWGTEPEAMTAKIYLDCH